MSIEIKKPIVTHDLRSVSADDAIAMAFDAYVSASATWN